MSRKVLQFFLKYASIFSMVVFGVEEMGDENGVRNCKRW